MGTTPFDCLLDVLMKKVMVFGSFDILHQGHLYFLNEARRFGEELIVVIARDETILKVKGHKPKYNEKERTSRGDLDDNPCERKRAPASGENLPD